MVRVNGIFNKIAINEEEVDGEGVIQVKSLKIGEVVTLTENDEDEKVEVDSGIKNIFYHLRNRIIVHCYR